MDNAIQLGIEFASSLVNTAVAKIISEPDISALALGETVATGAAGTLSGLLVKEAGSFICRKLTNIETGRAVGAAVLAKVEISEKIKAGFNIRDDDFFRLKTGTRTSAEQLFEAMMFKSKNQYEEQKVRNFANLFVNACFDEDLSADLVSGFMLILDRLTVPHLITINELLKLGEKSKWNSDHKPKIMEVEPAIAVHLYELEGLGFIFSTQGWGGMQIKPTPLAAQFITAIGFSDFYENNFEQKKHLISCNGKF